MLFGGELKQGVPAVYAHPEIGEAEGEQKILAGFGGFELFGRDGLSGRDARREAGICGFVPCGQPRLFGQAAYLRLGESADAQRGEYALLAERPVAGAVAYIVAGIGAVDDEIVAVGA